MRGSRQHHVLWVGIILAVWWASFAMGQGLLGKRYVGVEVGAVYPGDSVSRELDDQIMRYSLVLNAPANSHVDLRFSAVYVEMEGESGGVSILSVAHSYSGGVNYQFLPGAKWNPCLGGTIGFVKRKAEASIRDFTTESRMENAGWSLLGGLDVALSARVSLRPVLLYSRVGDDDDVLTHVAVSVWITDSIYGSGAVRYGLGEKDILYTGGLGVRF